MSLGVLPLVQSSQWLGCLGKTPLGLGSLLLPPVRQGRPLGWRPSWPHHPTSPGFCTGSRVFPVISQESFREFPRLFSTLLANSVSSPEPFKSSSVAQIFLLFWLHSMWGPSFPTRDGTCSLCIGSTALTTGHPGKSHKCIDFPTRAHPGPSILLPGIHMKERQTRRDHC